MASTARLWQFEGSAFSIVVRKRPALIELSGEITVFAMALGAEAATLA
jgi:hypothetical protein